MMKLKPGKLYRLLQGDNFWSSIEVLREYWEGTEDEYMSIESESILLFVEQETVKITPKKEYNDLYWFLAPNGQKVVTWLASTQRRNFGLWYKEIKP